MSDCLDNGEGKRLCWFCRHFVLQVAHSFESDVTPADSNWMECKKGHYGRRLEDSAPPFDDVLGSRAIRLAADCPDYEVAEGAAK